MSIEPPTDLDIRNSNMTMFDIRPGGKWGYIDKTGKMVIEPQFNWCGEFVEGLAPFRILKEGENPRYPDEKFGFIDKYSCRD